MAEQNKLELILQEQDVAKENAKQLLEAFGAPFTEAGEILATHKDIVVTEEDQFDLMADAREKRLKLKNIRVDVEKKRKQLKEDSLKTGRAIDSVAKFVKDTIEPAEKYLEEQEKFAEIKAAERKAKLKAERVEKLMQYTDDITMYSLDDITDEQFSTLESDLKKQHDDKIAEEKRLEKERVEKEKADAKARQEEIEENKRLKREAEERDEADRKKQKAEEEERNRVNEIKSNIKAYASHLPTIAECDKASFDMYGYFNTLDETDRQNEIIIAAKDSTLSEIREAKDQLKADAERQAAKAAEEEERKALLAPDKQKLINFAEGLNTVRKEKLPAVKSKQAQDVINIVDDELNKLYERIVQAAKQL